LKAGPIEPEASRGAVGVEHGVSGDNNMAANIYDHVTLSGNGQQVYFSFIIARIVYFLLSLVQISELFCC